MISITSSLKTIIARLGTLLSETLGKVFYFFIKLHDFVNKETRAVDKSYVKVT